MVSSARSLGEASNSSASRASSSFVWPLRPCPLDRTSHDEVAAGLIEPLGAGRDDGKVLPSQERGKWGGAAAFQPQIKVERIERSQGREPLRQVDLEHVAGRDVLLHPADRRQVPLSVERADRRYRFQWANCYRLRRFEPRDGSAPSSSGTGALRPGDHCRGRPTPRAERRPIDDRRSRLCCRMPSGCRASVSRGGGGGVGVQAGVRSHSRCTR